LRNFPEFELDKKQKRICAILYFLFVNVGRQCHSLAPLVCDFLQFADRRLISIAAATVRNVNSLALFAISGSQCRQYHSPVSVCVVKWIFRGCAGPLHIGTSSGSTSIDSKPGPAVGRPGRVRFKSA
jgi:hypothetical protein